MIRAEEGEVEINGDLPTLCSELTCILTAFRENNFPEYFLKEAITLGLVEDKYEYMKQKGKQIDKELEALENELEALEKEHNIKKKRGGKRGKRNSID